MKSIRKTLDFLIIGAGKSGTTSLSYYLGQHPDICITRPKEPWFFDTRDYFSGLDWYWEKYLHCYSSESLVGEASSQTLFVPYAPQRLKETVPDAKLIAILRNPVDRAYSDWWMKHSEGIDPLPFDDAIINDLQRIRSGIDFSVKSDWQSHIDSLKSGKLKYRCYVDYGYYADQLERYLRLFPRKQLLILTYDELVTDTIKIIKKIHEFLGIFPSHEYYNSIDIQARNTAKGKLERSIEKKLRNTIWSRRAPSHIKAVGRRFLTAADPAMRPTMPHSTRTFLVKHYNDQIERVENILGRKLGSWRL